MPLLLDYYAQSLSAMQDVYKWLSLFSIKIAENKKAVFDLNNTVDVLTF